MKIILPVLCSLLLIGCSDSTPDQTPPSPTVVASIVEPANPMPAAKEAPSLEVTPAAASAVPATQTALEKEPSQPVVTKETTAPLAQKEVVPAPAPKKAVTTASVDGGALFSQKCASCHGAKAEKSALGKSAIIADFSEQQVKEALKGYQAGTYGKEMKALMQGQAKGLNEGQIDALAKHISSL